MRSQTLLIPTKGSAGSSGPPVVADWLPVPVAGQSNMQGFTGGTTLSTNGYDVARPNASVGTVYYWDELNAEVRDITNTAATPKDTYGNPDNIAVRSVDGGLLNKLGIDLAASTGKKIIFVDGSVGGSGVVSGVNYGVGKNWTDDGLGTSFLTQWTNLKSYMASNSMTWELWGMLWCLGESEATQIAASITNRAAVITDTKTLFATFQAAMSGDLKAGKTLINIIRTGALKAPGYGEWTDAQVAKPSGGSYGNHEKEFAYQKIVDDVSYCRFVHGEALYYNRTAWNGIWDTVHFFQSRYNEIGAHVADELETPGSVTSAPEAVTGLSVTNQHPWRNDLSWTNPLTGAGNVHTGWTEFRIHRSTVSGFTPDDTNMVGASRDTSITSWEDEFELRPGVTYYYKVVTWNTVARTESAQASATTETLAAIPDAFETVTSTASVELDNLWTDLVAAGLNVGLRAFWPMKSGMQAGTPTTVYNMIRPSTTTTLFDLTSAGSIAYNGTSGYLEFDGTDDSLASDADGVIPINGNYSHLLALDIPTPGTSRPIFHQNRSAPSGSQYNVLAQTDNEISWSITGPTTELGNGDGALINSGLVYVLLVYDRSANGGIGDYLLYANGSSTPFATYTANPRLLQEVVRAVASVGKVIGPNTFTAMEMPCMAVWNRALSGAEYATLHGHLVDHIT